MRELSNVVAVPSLVPYPYDYASLCGEALRKMTKNWFQFGNWHVEQASRGTTMFSYIPKGISGRFPVKIRSVMLKVPDRTFKPGRNQTAQEEEGRRIRILIEPKAAGG